MIFQCPSDQPILVDGIPIVSNFRMQAKEIKSKRIIKAHAKFDAHDGETKRDYDIQLTIQYPEMKLVNQSLTISVVGEELQRKIRFNLKVQIFPLRKSCTVTGSIGKDTIEQTIFGQNDFIHCIKAILKSLKNQ